MLFGYQQQVIAYDVIVLYNENPKHFLIYSVRECGLANFQFRYLVGALEPHMVEWSPSGLYTSVFAVLYYCGRRFLWKIAT